MKMDARIWSDRKGDINEKFKTYYNLGIGVRFLVCTGRECGGRTVGG
jgi:hypothetical protein